MYEVGTEISFSANHVLPGVDGPEGRLHSHDYKVVVVVKKAHLGPEGMVVDLDVLRDSVRETIEGVEGRDLDLIRPSDREAVTVEVLAEWISDSLAARLPSRDVDELIVRVYEDDQSFGGYTASFRER